MSYALCQGCFFFRRNSDKNRLQIVLFYVKTAKRIISKRYKKGPFWGRKGAFGDPKGGLLFFSIFWKGSLGGISHPKEGFFDTKRDLWGAKGDGNKPLFRQRGPLKCIFLQNYTIRIFRFPQNFDKLPHYHFRPRNKNFVKPVWKLAVLGEKYRLLYFAEIYDLYHMPAGKSGEDATWSGGRSG